MGACAATDPEDEEVELEAPAGPLPAGITLVITSFCAGLALTTGALAVVPGPTAGSFPALSWKARNSNATAKTARAAITVGSDRGFAGR
jgi:hypothetical protein